MKKIKIIITVLLISIAFPAHSMENAQDAINDGRTLPIITEGPWKVCTGFLYSDRIVLTAGHCLFDIRNGEPHPKLYVGLPGKTYSKDAPKIPVETMFFSENWSFKGSNDLTDREDFGVLVLKESVYVVGSVTIATENQITKYFNNKTMISTIGYGRQSVTHEHNDITVPKYAEFPMASFSDVEQELQGAWAFMGQKKYWGMKIHLLETPNGPSTCGGDSGSPFYVKEGNNFVYLGPLSWGIGGMPACTGSGWKSNVMYIGSVAAYDYLNLIKQAEDYVGVKTIPTNIVNVNKITIQCYKGKVIKKISGVNPKCPKGYKVKV